MSKTKIGLSVLLIVVLALIGIYYANVLKTESLAKDILSDVNFDKVQAKFVYHNKTDKKHDFDKNDSKKIIEIFKIVELKGVVKKPKLKNDYMIYVGGSGGSFQFDVSDDGFVYLDKKTDKYYKFADKELHDELLNIIKKQYP